MSARIINSIVCAIRKKIQSCSVARELIFLNKHYTSSKVGRVDVPKYKPARHAHQGIIVY